MKAAMRESNGESGQSLLQLMIVVAIMGIMGILVARLTTKVGFEWMAQQLYARLDFGAQSTRRLLASQIRDASASTVQITRASSGQPLCSKVSWVDASSSSRTVYQVADKLYAADWSGCITCVANVQTVVREGLLAFAVYYPNSKDLTKIGFNLTLAKQVISETNPASPKYKPPVTLVVNAEVELKNP
jgi:hypothetical protein